MKNMEDWTRSRIYLQTTETPKISICKFWHQPQHKHGFISQIENCKYVLVKEKVIYILKT